MMHDKRLTRPEPDPGLSNRSCEAFAPRNVRTESGSRTMGNR